MSDCPRCGCNRYKRIDTKRVFGAVCDVLECDHCGKIYRVKVEAQDPEEEDVGIIETAVRCPRCNSENVPTYSTKGPVKYRKCKQCGHTFKSIKA